MSSDDFNVGNLNQLKTDINTLVETNRNIRRLIRDINSNLSQIRRAWRSDSQDKQTSVEQLQGDINSLSELLGALEGLKSRMTIFMEQAINATRG